MFTRCQACHTVHPVNAALLARSGGRFRCGKCRKFGNALDALFDEWPDAGAEPPQPGTIPELSASLSLVRDENPELPAEKGAEAGDAETLGAGPRRSRAPLRVLWIAGALLLLVVVTFAAFEFVQKPLPEQPSVNAALIRLGLREPPPQKPFSDLSRIELVNRELRSHPIRPNVLQLTATIVNRASEAQAYPRIEVSLLGIDSQVVSRHLFEPADYLSSSAEIRRGMPPGAYLPFAVDLVDPGERAVGFELEFR